MRQQPSGWRAVRSSLAAALMVQAIGLAAGCGNMNAALEQLGNARQLSGDLLVQFTKAADASDRAVMADTDEASVAYAKEADEARAAEHRDIDALTPVLDGLRFADEARLLREFSARFAEYETLDRRILDMAVENTNLKAQGLSFGPAQAAADRFREALEAVSASAPGDTWHVKALVASAVSDLREIQVLQAPHIAEADDAAMTRLEEQMAASESGVRKALAAIGPLAAPDTGGRLAAAAAAFDQFMRVNAQLLDLSRRNTNVRSLALSLKEKPAAVAACEDPLHRLRAALDARVYTVGRW